MNAIDELKCQKIETLYSKAEVYPYAFDTAPLKDDVTPPYAVVIPQSVFDVQKIVKIANKYNLKIISRGSGTCHTSGCKPTENSIIIHFSKMNKIIEINKENLTAIVESGVILGQLQYEADRFGLFFPPDPSNLKVSTIGGAIALSSGGPRTFKYGSIKDYVINLEVVLADGTIIETGKDVAKNVTGYNLTSLFTGSEGTLGIITKATLKLIPKPEYKLVTMAYFDSLNDCATCVNKIIDSRITPSTIDLIDKNTIDTIEKFNPSGLLSKEGMLLIELDGSKIEVTSKNDELKKILEKWGAVEIVQAKNEEENERIWNARRSAFACTAKLKPNAITEDVVVPREQIVPLINQISKMCKENNLTVCIMGHAGDGNIHPNFALDLSDKDEVARFNKVKDELFRLAVTLGGTLSGEHGIGYEKKKYLDFGIDQNAFEMMKKIKKVFDPKNILNPELIFNNDN